MLKCSGNALLRISAATTRKLRARNAKPPFAKFSQLRLGIVGIMEYFLYLA